MDSFITRVELHGGSPDDYERLHAAMAAALFIRTVKAPNGKVYDLPTAMYYSHGDLTASDVRDLAINAAKLTGRNYWIFTAQWLEAAWVLNERLS